MASASCLCAISIERLRVGLHAGRGLGVHERDDASRRGFFLSASSSFCGSTGSPHSSSTTIGDAAAALDVLDHAAAEHAVAAHDDLVAGRDQVDEAVLHADRARARRPGT